MTVVLVGCCFEAEDVADAQRVLENRKLLEPAKFLLIASQDDVGA